MNIVTVAQSGATQDVAHQSAYLYGVEKKLLPPKAPEPPGYVTLPGPGRMETSYVYKQAEGWLGDAPASFTFLMAYRSYEYTKQVFSDYNRKMATSESNRWVV